MLISRPYNAYLVADSDFVFSFVLLNGCHACEVGGYAQIAFDFNRAGEFLGTKSLRLSKTR